MKEHNIVQLEEEKLVQAIKTDFALDIENPQKVIRGFSSQVYEATIGGKKVYIRINKNATKYEAEIKGYELFKEVGIPVPVLLGYKENPVHIGLPTMILESAQGVDIGRSKLDAHENQVIYEKLGALMKKMHTIHLDGFGDVHVADGVMQGKFLSWAEFWKSAMDKNLSTLEFLLENKILSLDEVKKIERIHAEIFLYDIGKSSLLHLDMHKGHVFVEDGEISGVIDLGRLTAGDPRYDIAMSYMFQDAAEKEAFARGYGDVAKDDAIKNYMILIATDKIKFRIKREQKQELVDPLIDFLHTSLENRV